MAVFDSQPSPLPRVPGGYRVVEVANEQVPPQPPPTVLQRRKQSTPRNSLSHFTGFTWLTKTTRL